MNECTEAGAKQFMSSIRPIYGSSKNMSAPIHIGTCILIEISKTKYMVSAAHVFDENKYNSLYLGARSELELVVGDIYTTQKVNGNRSEDHFDFAWMKLTSELLSKLDNVKFISENDLANEQEDPHGRLYLALGYPNSKNKKVNIQKKSVTPKFLKYSSTVKSKPSLCEKLRITGNEHLFLDFDSKQSKDSDGNIVMSVKPTGISGGGLIDMGNISKPKNFLPGIPCVGKLAGILIENHKEHKAMSAVKIGVIVNQIKKSPNKANSADAKSSAAD